MEVNVRELITKKELLNAFQVLQDLRKDLNEESYLSLLEEMQQDGYRVFALLKREQIVVVSGLAVRTNFYNRRHVFIYDLVTHTDFRSQGYGDILLSHIHKWAKEQDCSLVALESGLFREEAHRFYEEKMGYEKFCYSFTKKV